jgi:hypothetical protein
MANNNFIVQNGLTAGPLTIDATTGNLTTTGSITSTGGITVVTQEIVLGTEVVAGNLVANSGTTSSSTTTGALVVTGGVGISGALNVGGTVNATNNILTNLSSTTAQATNFSTGNAVISGGTFSGITSTAATTATFTNLSSGNIYSTGAHIPSANATVNLGGTSNYWNNFYAVSGTFNTITVGAGGGILPAANVAVNIGSSSSWFNTFYGISTQAKYADLAENYQADKAYAPGTVLMFGGDQEVTAADADTRAVAGVVSTNPAHLMNGGLTGSNVVPVALQGRVPCMVIGPVKKGDMLVSAGFGYAKSSTDPQLGQVIGKALYDFPGNSKAVIEVVVGRM